MKKILLSLVLVMSTASLFAQNQKVQSAILYNRHGELDKAQAAIDEAILNPKTSESAKTWYYRGEVYLSIFGSEQYASLASDPLVTALESYSKSLVLDLKNDFSDDSRRKIGSAFNTIYNRGVGSYSKGYSLYLEKDSANALMNFTNALADFERLLVLTPGDTNLIFNAALASEKLNDNARAVKYFNNLLAIDFKTAAIYQTLAQIMKEEKDTARAIEYLAAGRKAFPNEVGLVIDELNIYMLQNRQAEIVANLNEAIKLAPENATLYYALGYAHDRQKNEELAALNYSKAIEKKPDYFEPYYNLGALYFNKSVEMLKEANKIPFNQPKKYEESMVKVKAAFEKAQPFLEKAHELNPADIDAMTSLQQLYVQTKQNEKALAMKKKKDDATKPPVEVQKP
jgi:tetratricopeptide (TPR) repeat protein